LRPFALLSLLLVTACAPSAADTPADQPTQSSLPQHVTVLAPPPDVVDEVVDGRTVVLSNGLKAHVLGLAPPAECWSAGALRFAKDTLLGKQVRYSRASETAITLRLADNSDYAFLAVSKGAARAEKDDPVLTEPEKAAAAAGVGLWGPPCKGSDTTPTSAPPPPPSAPVTSSAAPVPQKDCTVTYRLAQEWAGGFHAEMIVRNNTQKPFAQWKLYWRFPSGQQIQETWGMKAFQYGADVVAVSQDGYGTIGAGAQVSLRFNAAGKNAAPAGYMVNGVACSVG
jgi:hypothetical protein